MSTLQSKNLWRILYLTNKRFITRKNFYFEYNTDLRARFTYVFTSLWRYVDGEISCTYEWNVRINCLFEGVSSSELPSLSLLSCNCDTSLSLRLKQLKAQHTVPFSCFEYLDSEAWVVPTRWRWLKLAGFTFSQPKTIGCSIQSFL